MKKLKLSALISMFALMATVSTSCQKETMLLTSDSNIAVSTDVISLHAAMQSVDSVVSISSNLHEELSRGTAIEQLEATRQKEAELAVAFKPLTDCGEQLRTNLLIAASDPNSGFTLSNEELQILNDINDAELAEMMLIVLMAGNDDVPFDDNSGMMISTGRAKDCLWEALGINDIIPILKTIGVGSLTKAVHVIMSMPKHQLFKALAKLTGKANYIMLAYMAAEFAYCMLSEDAYMVPTGSTSADYNMDNLELAKKFEGEVFKYPVSLQITND